MARYNYTISGKFIENTPENEETLKTLKMSYPPLPPVLKNRRDKNRAKNRIARKSRRKNR